MWPQSIPQTATLSIRHRQKAREPLRLKPERSDHRHRFFVDAANSEGAKLFLEVWFYFILKFQNFPPIFR